MIVNKYANGNGGGGGTGSTITVDAALSSSSTNPVENRVITNALSEYTTNEYVEGRFDSAEAYTDSQVNNLEEQMNEAISAATEDLASTQYVDDAIAGIVIPEPPADYATTGDVANAVEGLASETYVNDAISTATEHMVTTDDLQDYATTGYVDDAVNGITLGIGMLGMVNDVSESNGTVTVMKTTMQEGQLVTGSTSFDIVTSGDVATAITAATQNFATEQYVDDAVSSATTEIYEYVDAAILTGATITVDDALSTASTNPVENRVIANKFGDYYTKAETDTEITAATSDLVSNIELTGATVDVPIVFGEDAGWQKNMTYEMYAYNGEGSWLIHSKLTNVDNLVGFQLSDYVNFTNAPYGVYIAYTKKSGYPAMEVSETTTATTDTFVSQVYGSSLTTNLFYIVPSTLDGTYDYKVLYNLDDNTFGIFKNPSYQEEVHGILDDYMTSGETQNAITSATQNFVTSGDVQTIVDDAVATAITIDSALSSSSTNPVQNQAITNALGNYATEQHMLSYLDGYYGDEQLRVIPGEIALSIYEVVINDNAGTQFLRTTSPDYVAIDLSEVDQEASSLGFSQVTSPTGDVSHIVNVDTDMTTADLGVAKGLISGTGTAEWIFRPENFDGTYNYYLLLNVVSNTIQVVKNLPVLEDIQVGSFIRYPDFDGEPGDVLTLDNYGNPSWYSGFVTGSGVKNIVKCTQAEYDAMQSHDQNTFYIITNS